MVTVWAEGHGLDGFALIGLEDSLRLVADAVEFDEVVEGGEGEQVHVLRPERAGDLRGHQLLDLHQELLLVLLVHYSNNAD